MSPAPAVSGLFAGAGDTIAALATPSGRGAIAVIRMSGASAFEIARTIISPWPLIPRQQTVCRITGDAGAGVDQALVTAFIGPDSFSGEDIVEISTHGGHYVPAMVLELILLQGARMATPGEFTRRAVFNGKLDVTQAEAIGDLIDARSRAMHRTALNQLDGGLSRRVALLRSEAIRLESLIAYDIDFPEEDDGPVPRDRILSVTDGLLDSLGKLLATIPVGEVIKEGALVVIAGEPNVGKSSLFNALLGRSRAIVTDIPGTTRDALEALIETGQWPIRLVDTAGLRSTDELVERMGIEVSRRYLAVSDVVLACGDSGVSIDMVGIALAGRCQAPVIRVRTKSDLRNEEEPDSADISVSAATGEGIAGLIELLDRVLSKEVGSAGAEMPVLIRARHIAAIRQAHTELASFRDRWFDGHLPAPVAAVHLRAATTALESLIGAVNTDDVLDQVFGSFCVGK